MSTPKVLQALQCILDATDYTTGACGVTEMVGAVLPAILIDKAREAIAEATQGGKS